MTNVMKLVRGAAISGIVASLSLSAAAQYSAYFSMTGQTWIDETSFWLEGVRIVGLGLTADDEVRARFVFRPSDASFVLAEHRIIGSTGVVHRDTGFTSRDVTPAVPTFVAAGKTYLATSEARQFTSTASSPFSATIQLQVGHVLSVSLDEQTKPYSYELLDPAGAVISAFDGDANDGVIFSPYRVTTSGTYTIRVRLRGTGSLSFRMGVFNANGRTLQTLSAGSEIKASFAEDLRDYYKAQIQLSAGQRVTLPKPNDDDIVVCLLDSFSRVKNCAVGLSFSYRASESGTYFLFAYSAKGWGGSYSGVLQIAEEAQGLTTRPERAEALGVNRTKAARLTSAKSGIR